jgi:hypothetical protein
MKYRLILLFCLFVQVQGIFAQQPLQVNRQVKKTPRNTTKNTASETFISDAPATAVIKKDRCGFATMMQRAKAKGYDEALYEEAFKKLVKKRLASNQTAFSGIVTIPVIFHSIYRNGQAVSNTTPNLTAAKYQAQLDQMNKDYANLSGSAYGVAADVRIRFCLAVVDTAGRTLAEPGIDRINGSTRGWSNTNTMNENTLVDYFENTIKPASIWDPYSYFNVWTAAMNTSGLLGYATFPSLSTLQGLDNTESDSNAGVVINWQSVGSLASPGTDENYGNGRTLVHESGHFFGLRHIWGDANCGNDYCNDTPPQDDATTGCPAAGTLNNCTPSQVKMFENYMDYSYDACLNTFTADQALRCQAAIDNSPRRSTLISSKSCQARAANAIQFVSAKTYQISETGPAGNCPNSRTYSFNIYVSDKASGAATLNFYVAGGTATINKDYTISPASVAYIANDNGVKTLTVTIIDDQVTEPTETIEIGYTITGIGVVAGPEKQTVSIKILDDDAGIAEINNTSTTKTILSENFNASTNIPTGWTTEVYGDGTGSYTPNQWVVSANGGTGTSGNAAHITRSTSSKPNQYTNTNASDAYLFTPLLDATGTRNVTVSFKWRCLGETDYDMGYIGYVPEGQLPTADNVQYLDTFFVGLSASTSARTANLTMPVALSNSKFYLVFNWYNDESTGSNPPFTIDDVVVTGQYFAVAGTADADTAFAQYAGQTVAYYSQAAVGRLIATISNPSEDLGCITAAIKQPGTGRQVLLTTAGGYYRTDKIVTLTPASANSTAAYQATLYYTTDELSNAWSPAEIPLLKLIKVKEGVDLSGTINAADVVAVTPVFSDKSASGYYSYTGSFTGFSQFMLGLPTSALPVRYISFDAKTKGNAVALTWVTAEEINNKGFALERSTNGVQFETLAWINAKSNTAAQSNYAYTDNFVQPGITYYYRLRQVDKDGGENISAVKQARIAGSKITVTVSPVPAHDVLNVYISGNASAATVILVNMQGQMVRSVSNIAVQNSQQKIDVKNLPSGIYSLRIQLPDETIVRKVIVGQ